MSSDVKATWGKNFKLILVKPKDVQRNPWNPNKMDEETFAKEKLSIQNNGFIDPIKVRELEDGELEIVDGEHRWRVAAELGLKTIPAINLGPISDQQAKKLTIIANELRGSPEPALLAALLRDLAVEQKSSELSVELPMSTAEIDAMIKASGTFDWAALAEENTTGEALSTKTSPIGAPRTPETDNADSKQVRIGLIKAEVPVALMNGLYAEYERSAAAIGSNTPEAVLRDWVARLKETAPDTDARAADLPAAPPPKAKKKAAKKAKAA